MTNREPLEQNKHDTILNSLAKQLTKEGKDVRINPNNTNQNAISEGIEKIYPDLFVVENNKVVEIYEVETENTVNESSVEQWIKYSKLSEKFYLVFPGDKLSTIKELTTKHTIKVDGYYTWV